MKTILLVDERPDDLSSILEGLSAEQHRIITARNEAMALSELRGNVIDLVIMNYRISNMNGFELVTAIRRQHPLVPVILVSPYYNIESYLRTLGIGVFDYLSKPVHPPALLNAVDAALKGPGLTDTDAVA